MMLCSQFAAILVAGLFLVIRRACGSNCVINSESAICFFNVKRFYCHEYLDDKPVRDCVDVDISCRINQGVLMYDLNTIPIGPSARWCDSLDLNIQCFDDNHNPLQVRFCQLQCSVSLALSAD